MVEIVYQNEDLQQILFYDNDYNFLNSYNYYDYEGSFI